MIEKYGLVVGCNYANTKSELMGCINDAKSINEILIKRFGFQKDHVMLLTDDVNPKSMLWPTAFRIKWALTEFFSVCKGGDLVFFYFAGHGTDVPADKCNTKKKEQAICASDLNLIACPDFRKILTEAPRDVQFVFVSDSCHSGELIDTVKVQIGPTPKGQRSVLDLNDLLNNMNHTDNSLLVRRIPFEVILQILTARSSNSTTSRALIANNGVPALFVQQFGEDGASLIFRNNAPMPRALTGDLAILLSGCQPTESSYECTYEDKQHGYFTSSILDTLKRSHSPISNKMFVLRARKFIIDKKVRNQHPCLYCGDKNLRASFLFQ